MTTVLPVEPLYWEHRAECRNHDPELWWPVSAGGRGETPTAADHAAASAAVAICRNHCPVQQECLDQAIATGERHGIWGGLWPHERAKHAQQRGLPEPDLTPNLSRTREAQRTRAVRVLRDSGASTESIAAYFGVRVRTVERWLWAIDKAGVLELEGST